MPKTASLLPVIPMQRFALFLTLLVCVHAVADTGTWTTDGPDGGHVTTLVLDPQNENTVWIGTSDNGIWRSQDSGATWQSRNQGLLTSIGIPFVYSIAVHPVSSTTVYASLSGATGGRVVKSTDGGSTWSTVTGINTTFEIALEILFDPQDSQTLYCLMSGSSFDGIEKSVDGGITWNAYNTGLPSGLFDSAREMAIDPVNSQNIYISMDSSVYKSTNGGLNWAMSGTGLPDDNYVVLTVDPTTPSIVYAGTEDYLYRSDDSGVTWTEYLWDYSEPAGLVVDPNDSTTLYAAEVNFVLVSHNSGQTFSTFYQGLMRSPASDVLVSPSGVLWAASETRGMVKSTDDGATWSEFNHGLIATSVQDLALNPSDATVLYACASDMVYRKNLSARGAWELLDFGPDLYRSPGVQCIAIAPSDDDIIYVGGNGFSRRGTSDRDYVARSNDGGDTWAFVGNKPDSRFYDIGSIVVDPVDPDVVYCSPHGKGIYKSTDAGETFVQMQTLTSSFRSQLVMDPQDAGTLYCTESNVSHTGTIWKSTNYGSTWATVDTGLNGYGVLCLAVDPGNSQVLYAGTAAHGVYKSTNGGASWTASNSGLDTAIHALMIAPDDSSTLYAGTSLHDQHTLYRSSDSGASWGAFDPGITRQEILCFTLDPFNPTQLFAGSDGAGVYEGDFPCTPVSITTHPQDADYCPGEQVTLTVAASGDLPIHYQWYRGETGDTDHPVGTDSDTFQITTSSSVSYWVRVSNSCSAADSDEAWLSSARPSYTPNPWEVAIASGQTTDLRLQGDGLDPITFQWYQGAVGDTSQPVGSPTQSTDFTTPTLSATTQFWATATNTCGTYDSSRATKVWVNIAPRLYEGSSEPLGTGEIACSGGTADLQVQVLGTEPMTYSWYTGTTGDTSHPQGTVVGDPNFTTPAVSQDTEFWVRVSNTFGTLDVGTVWVEVVDPLQMDEQPTDTTACYGEGAVLNASVVGTFIDYTWFQGESGDMSTPLDSMELPGTTSPITQATPFWIQFENPCGTLDSDTVWVTLADLEAGIAPPAQAQGLDPLTLDASISCAIPSFAWSWIDLNTQLPFGAGEDPVNVPVVSQTTIIQLNVEDALSRRVAQAQAVILRALNDDFLDLDGDGQNTACDILEIIASWRQSQADDADGDGRMTVLDFLYINTDDGPTCP